jgi:thioredoxin reductase
VVDDDVAELSAPHPPGDYPVVVVGSGPGGLQVSYALGRLGIAHAVLSSDPAPGGMFRSFPFFQRLISWTKPHAPAERGTRAYERYDWNSLVADEPAHAAPMWEFMDGSSYFPAREEMERGLVAFSERAGVRVRGSCTWESTRRTDDGFVLGTSDGEYRCGVLIVAVGTTRPWKPPGLEAIPHYVETREREAYADKDVFIVGKRNSGFELADGLLATARRVILASPRPATMSVVTRSTTGARARYLQPFEDHFLGGGTYILDAAIERAERTERGFRIVAKGTTVPHEWTFDVDEAIAATGFTTPLVDLPALGVATFQSGRLPAQTPHWESSTVPGIYFAGCATQGAQGLRKYGIGSNSAAVQGFRYNARVLARHVARVHFGLDAPRPAIDPADVVPLVLRELAECPELWNQPSYLCRVITADPALGVVDDGVALLEAFVDATGPDAVAFTIETDGTGDIHPAVYVRRDGRVEEHVLTSDPLLDFSTPDHRRQLGALLDWLVR